MHIDFTPPTNGTYNNSGSSRRLANYLEHEDLERMEKGIYTEGFFNLTEDNIYKSKVIKDIDSNIGQLLKTGAKFYAIHVSPSEKELRAMGNTEQEQAEARSNWMRIDRKEDLKDWRSYCYQIDQKLRQLYQAQEIPKTYQGAIAMSLFVSYLQTGRCDTLKECMNKFDDDSAFYQLKGEIEEIIREIGEMKQRLSRELSFTRQCLNDDLENVELLVQKNQTQIEQISYNQETQRLLLATAFLEEQ